MKLYELKLQKPTGPRGNPMHNRRTVVVLAEDEAHAGEIVRDHYPFNDPIVSIREINEKVYIARA